METERHWNYRLVEKEEVDGDGNVEKYINVHTVHYESSGAIRLYSATPVCPQGKSLSGILKDLAYMQEAASKPILRLADLEDAEKRKTLR